MGKLPTLTFMSSVYNNMRGFTLLELLLVISVIAILISITLPALNGGREFAKQTMCQKNFNQLAVITTDYYNQYKGLPWAPDDPMGDMDREGTPSYFEQFATILKCPKGARLSDRGSTDSRYFYFFGWKITNGAEFIFPSEELYHKYNLMYMSYDAVNKPIVFMERDRPHFNKRWVLYMDNSVKLQTEEAARLPF